MIWKLCCRQLKPFGISIKFQNQYVLLLKWNCCQDSFFLYSKLICLFGFFEASVGTAGSHDWLPAGSNGSVQGKSLVISLQFLTFRVLPLLPQNKMQLLSRFFSCSKLICSFGFWAKNSYATGFIMQNFNTSDYRKNLKRSWPTYSLSAHLLAFRGWMFLSRFTFVLRSR